MQENEQDDKKKKKDCLQISKKQYLSYMYKDYFKNWMSLTLTKPKVEFKIKICQWTYEQSVVNTHTRQSKS